MKDYPPVSDDLQSVLDHLDGIPEGKEEEAKKIQSRALGGSSPDVLGIWFGG